MKINDLIFKELIKRGFTLEGNTRVWNLADSKLWYLTPDQAQGFLDLESADNYKMTITNKEINLIRKYLPTIESRLGRNSYNVVDLGCGDGEKASLFISQLSRHLKIRYCPIDISSYMVQSSAKKMRDLELSEVVEFKWNVSDFENLVNVIPLLRSNKFKQNVFLLLGNTLGNFDEDELLYSIYQSMKKGDFLLVGNSLSNGNKKDLVKPYKDKNVDKFLIKVLQQIGFSKKDLDFGVRFSNSRIEVYYRLKKDKVIKHLNKKILFNQNDVIVVGVSYRYSEEKFKGHLKAFFKKIQLFSDAKRDYMIAFCSK